MVLLPRHTSLNKQRLDPTIPATDIFHHNHHHRSPNDERYAQPQNNNTNNIKPNNIPPPPCHLPDPKDKRPAAAVVRRPRHRMELEVRPGIREGERVRRGARRLRELGGGAKQAGKREKTGAHMHHP
jgi:hypothetical protein